MANLDYSEYVGRLAIGRIYSGEIALGDQVSVAKPDGSFQKVRVSQLYAFEGLKREPVQRAGFGEIVALAGVDNVEIGDTITSVDNPQPLPSIAVDEPTISMIFGVNNSPFAGKDGKYVTSRQVKERLDKEILGNVAIRVEETESPEQFKVSGRGELQLSILIEMMRREGLRDAGFQAGSDHPRERRTHSRTDRAGCDRLSGRVYWRRYRGGRPSEGTNDEDG